MQIARTRRELDAALAAHSSVAMVPTMGALHDGHLALVAAARQSAPVVASIFVNPRQFAAGEDLARYPRDEAGDLAMLHSAGCAIAFLPDVTEIYPANDATRLVMEGPALGFEGARRPGHFDGVATVVARLFGLVRPRTAWFGEKDWQQLQVVRRMVADLALPVAIHGVPTRRATDGLALSSRNRFLTEAQRHIAPALPRTCGAAAAAIAAGAPMPAELNRAGATLAGLGFGLDYLAVVAAETMQPLDRLGEPARLVAAAALGSVRLLDNWPIG